MSTIGLGKTSAIVAGVAVLGLLATMTMLPEPKGSSLEESPRARCRLARQRLGWRRSAGQAADAGLTLRWPRPPDVDSSRPGP